MYLYFFSCLRFVEMNSENPLVNFVMASDLLPAGVFNASNAATEQTLPDKSQTKYVRTYKKFMKWHKMQSTNSFSEEVLLAYFGEIAKAFAPATLLSTYSMIKPIIICKHNVDIGQYGRLLGFLKETKDAAVPIKPPSLLFSADGLTKFLTEAPDSEYIVVKAATVFAICGAWRGEMLTDIKMQYVTDYGKEIVVRVPDPDTKAIKVYPISCEMADFVRNYVRLRPEKIATQRFFIQYRDGKCTAQHIGKHTMAKMPKKIATYLGSSEPKEFNSKSFRKISTKIVADVKAKLRSWKRGDVSMSSAGCGASQPKFQRISQTTETTCGDPSSNSQQNFTTTNQVLVITRQAALDAAYTKDPNLRIKQEDEGDFEAGEYILSDSNRYNSVDIGVKIENDPVNYNQDSISESHGDENTIPTNRLLPEQRPISHEPSESFSPESNPTKRVKYSGDVGLSANMTTPCQNSSFCQQKIKAQADEIARLKELTKRQNLKIESLQVLLLDNLGKTIES